MIQDIFPSKFDNHYIAGKPIEDNDFVLHFEGNKLLLKGGDDTCTVPRKKDIAAFAAEPECTFLFTLNDVSCFLIWDSLPVDESRFIYKEISFFRTMQPKDMAWISVVGYHLWCWYSEHRFCGKCGARMHHKDDERAMVCPECHTMYFPKISPAIIVAIIKGDKLLLARNVNFPGKWFSLIAGYVDVGETFEEAVIREAQEEVGIEVTNIRYYKSQPWPLSGSIMIGCIAEADPDQPVEVDHKEIAEAAWYTRGSLPEHPGNVSIAGEIIEKFERGEL